MYETAFQCPKFFSMVQRICSTERGLIHYSRCNIWEQGLRQLKRWTVLQIEHSTHTHGKHYGHASQLYSDCADPMVSGQPTIDCASIDRLEYECRPLSFVQHGAFNFSFRDIEDDDYFSQNAAPASPLDGARADRMITAVSFSRHKKGVSSLYMAIATSNGSVTIMSTKDWRTVHVRLQSGTH